MSQPRIVAGIHSVRNVLRHGADSIREAWVDAQRRDKRLKELVHELERAGILPQQVSREELDRIARGANHQGIIIRALAPAAIGEKQLPEILDRAEGPLLLLILDGVQDPHNLGACLRSADAAGVDAVIIPRDRSAPLNATARKVACGAAESLPVIRVTNLARTLRFLREAGVWIYGASGDAASSLYETDLCGPLALVLGGEGRGLRRLTREHCDGLLSIPMAGSISSLNVSVAAGVFLFEVRRQRAQSHQNRK